MFGLKMNLHRFKTQTNYLHTSEKKLKFKI